MDVNFPTLQAVIARHVESALHVARGNQRRAAELLGVSRYTVSRLVAKYKIDARALREAAASDPIEA